MFQQALQFALPIFVAATMWAQNAPYIAPEQLDNLVAPIALYPDALLSQVLVASTYPQDLAEANQWIQQNRNLAGQDLVYAAQQQNWDPSVQALVPFRDVLARLAQDQRWTGDLGNAFLSEQGEVMNAVQRMRQRAQQNGRLVSNQQENVSQQWQNGQQVIEIAPTDTQVVYVPSYDPEYIWGAPAYGYYPSLYYPRGYGFSYFPGVRIGAFFGGGYGGFGGWGWGTNWGSRSVYVNHDFFRENRYRDDRRGGDYGRTAWSRDGGRGGYRAESFAGQRSGQNYGQSGRGYVGSAPQRQIQPQQVQPQQQQSFRGNGNSGRGYASQGFSGQGYSGQGYAGSGQFGRSYNESVPQRQTQPQQFQQQQARPQPQQSFRGGGNSAQAFAGQSYSGGGQFGRGYGGNAPQRQAQPQQSQPQQAQPQQQQNFRNSGAQSQPAQRSTSQGEQRGGFSGGNGGGRGHR